MNPKTRITTLAHTGLVIALTAMLGGCAVSVPKSADTSPDRTVRRPHTAMRGPAHKRLILTLNESHHLSIRANEYADALEASGEVDPMTMLAARELADDTAQFADDVEWSVANNQRMKWHRTRLDQMWDRFVEIYPQDEDFAEGFRTKEMRKTTYKVRMKREYREKWGLDYAKVRDQVNERQRQEYLESM